MTFFLKQKVLFNDRIYTVMGISEQGILIEDDHGYTASVDPTELKPIELSAKAKP